ncbi:transcriptional regulator PpsR [Tateyamaria sp. ANG-S1]|uniref:transcriptional regulator PpsR n=1 Tax=Tateyamaria sp. ANG-S1 TaxID=1577905 RepID=UPI00057DDF1C|nr:transcriptional regulator PpsR [Tateyamaria sp. ANG-S1]KIC47822.1 transcriptional regulator [Tateyamaria sp. ANG-S1]
MTTGGSSFWTSGAVPLIEPEFLSSIIAAASDIALVVSAEGMILSVLLNTQDDSFGNLKHWEGRPVVEFLTDESIEKFQVAHDAYMAGQLPKKPLELNHSDNAVWQYPVRYTFHRFGQENAVLLLGRDLRPIAETQQQLVQAQIALEQGYEARREFDARYRVVMSNVDDAVVFVSVQSGRIEDANKQAAALLGLKPDALTGVALASLFSDRSVAELTESLMNATLSDDSAPVNVVTSRTRQEIGLYPVLFRASGQRVLMCRLIGSGAVPVSDGANNHASALFRATTDAIVFMDPRGTTLSVNDAFLDLVGATHLSDVVGQSLAEYLARGQIDLGVLLENAARSGQMRVYATRLVNDLGTRVPVEVSATALQDVDNPAVALIIRDVSRLEGVRKAENGSASKPEPGRNVMDLVGSASLKEIVAETTDVVEKMCIETAVNLTRNNRVAAAEMLGLSRQSLYVKLRKYGLLSKNG